MGNDNHPISNYWSAERSLECRGCGVIADVLYCAHIADKTPKKAYIYYTFAKNDVTYSVMGDQDGASLGINVKLGDALALIFGFDKLRGDWCAHCLNIGNAGDLGKQLLRTVLYNCKGKFHVISSNYVFIDATYGDIKHGL